jgi:hypothetical protein
MKPVRTLAFSALSLGVMTTGCVGQTAPDLVISSDPQLRAMAAELLPDLAARAGMELTRPVRLEVRSRDELVRYLEFKLDTELPAGEARDRADAYAMLGLVPADLDLRAVLLGLYTEQVAGFYEPDSTALFVLDDQPEEALEALLVHELVHAVQDQTADLDALTDPALGNDRATAAQAAIEGHATLVMFEYLTEAMTGRPIDLGQIPDFASQVRPALAAMNAQFPALARAPRVIRESLLFPYVDGAGFVQGLWTGGERLSPFGADLPLSTEQILRPDAEAPIELSLAVDGAETVLDDVLGSFELQILLEEVLGVPGGGGIAGQGEAGALAAAWDGDRYALVTRPDGSRGLAWYVLWADESSRDRFVHAVEERSGSFGGPVQVEPTQFGDHAASVVFVGGTGYTVSLELNAGAGQ